MTLILKLTIAALSAAATDAPPATNLVGTWHATRLLATAEEGPGSADPTPTAKAARKPLEHVVITEHGIKGCKSERKVYKQELIGTLQIKRLPQRNNLNLPENFTTIDYGNCGEFWLRKDGNLVAPADPYYFEMERVKQPHQTAKLK
jgi:hypothetical protein